MSRKGSRRRKARQAPPATQLVDGVEVTRRGVDRGTPERGQHGGLRSVDTYTNGERARPVRAEDTLDRLLRSESIDERMAGAGRRFAADFHLGALDELRAAPLERRIPGRGDDSAVLAARRRVAVAVETLGGHGTPAANAVWQVLGVGLTISEWARRERFGRGRHLHEHVAKGILVGALSALAALYFSKRRKGD